jgi:hypothetical protein
VPDFLDILGTGLMAQAAWDAAPNSLVYGSSQKAEHEVLNSAWRGSPVISNRGIGGLSRSYHGVTPAIVFDNPENEQPLQRLNLQVPLSLRGFSDQNFVPWKVPRPSLSPSGDIPANLREQSTTALCLSVMGNISFLLAQGFIQHADINDDIVFRAGRLSAKDAMRLFGKHRRIQGGTLFPFIRLSSCQISIRPVFYRPVDINFIDLRDSLLRAATPGDVFEKILKALYLRYGVQLKEVRYWEVFVQANVEAAYEVTSRGVRETQAAQTAIGLISHDVGMFMKGQQATSYVDDTGDVLCGIHLGYDRRILKGLPENILVLDTSLNSHRHLHPTIESYCRAFCMVKARVGHDT